VITKIAAIAGSAQLGKVVHLGRYEQELPG
jgi:hypothetical protein